MSVFWSNGRWIDGDELSLSPRDRGLMHGLGLFETILAVDGVPFLWDRHLARLRGAAGRLGWSLADEDLAGVMGELLERNGLMKGHARLRLAVTAGSGSLEDLRQGPDFRVWITASRLEMRDDGLRVMVSPWRRNERSPLAGLKCASYAENLLALRQARENGCDDVLMFNTAGWLCEAATANVFLVRDGGLVTPDLSSGCLPGTTRGFVLEQANRIGIPCVERPVSRDDLDQAEELFLCSSTRGPVEILELGGIKFCEGPITRLLKEAWRSAVASKS